MGHLRKVIPIAFVAALAACGGERAGSIDARAESTAVSGEVLVFAAASLRESLQELGTAFEQRTGARVVFNFAGSNDLAHQIDA
ncbi:MAG TPA: substrate-binding domain-containing protein, partial [Longimicrobium sp.]|nr:substrate-binding domain-containing protein [Longimicrobium sp.]